MFEKNACSRGPHHNADRSRPRVDPRRDQHRNAGGSRSNDYDGEPLPVRGHDPGRVRHESSPSEPSASVNHHADGQRQDDDIRICREFHDRQVPRGDDKEPELGEAREEACEDGRTGALEHTDGAAGLARRTAEPARDVFGPSAGLVSEGRALYKAPAHRRKRDNHDDGQIATSQADRVPVVYTIAC